MKDTRKRGHTIAEDAAGRTALAADEKNYAENPMITDLLRNNLSRIAEISSVKVTDLFTAETCRILHILTSGLTATRRPEVGTTDLLANPFPCGSITGAPPNCGRWKSSMISKPGRAASILARSAISLPMALHPQCRHPYRHYR
ncbi:MAG: chorismate-binding protein [Candidatus Devosia symbiotica]|nr:chorismate-binding protein [Candidatus Devosia symbiotica]